MSVFVQAAVTKSHKLDSHEEQKSVVHSSEREECRPWCRHALSLCGRQGSEGAVCLLCSCGRQDRPLPGALQQRVNWSQASSPPC